MSYLQKYVFQNIKAFNIIKNKKEARTITKHIIQTCRCECKNYGKYKKDFSDHSKYLKSIADTSVIACDEIISVMDVASKIRQIL